MLIDPLCIFFCSVFRCFTHFLIEDFLFYNYFHMYYSFLIIEIFTIEIALVASLKII